MNIIVALMIMRTKTDNAYGRRKDKQIQHSQEILHKSAEKEKEVAKEASCYD